MDPILITALLTGVLLAAGGALGYAWRGERGRRTRADDRAKQLEARIRDLESRLRDADERFERAEDAREAFFDLATHELRSPLAAILGYQELLADGAYGELNGGTEEPVDRIGRSAKHLLHLIDGVIEISRLRSGSVRPDLGPVELGVLFSAIGDTFREQARERSIVPEVSLPPTLPTFHSDQDRLLRALDLALISAIKHPAADRLRMDVTVEDRRLHVRLGPTDIELRQDVDDPAVRFGIRLAVAQGLARLLGGGLELETHADGRVTALAFHVADLDPTAETASPAAPGAPPAGHDRL